MSKKHTERKAELINASVEFLKNIIYYTNNFIGDKYGIFSGLDFENEKGECPLKVYVEINRNRLISTYGATDELNKIDEYGVFVSGVSGVNWHGTIGGGDGDKSERFDDINIYNFGGFNLVLSAGIVSYGIELDFNEEHMDFCEIFKFDEIGYAYDKMMAAYEAYRLDEAMPKATTKQATRRL